MDAARSGLRRIVTKADELHAALAAAFVTIGDGERLVPTVNTNGIFATA